MKLNLQTVKEKYSTAKGDLTAVDNIVSGVGHVIDRVKEIRSLIFGGKRQDSQ